MKSLIFQNCRILPALAAFFELFSGIVSFLRACVMPTGALRAPTSNGVTVARRGSHRMKEPCRLRSSVKHVKTARKWAVTGVENGPLLYYPVILVAKTVKTVIIIYIQTVCNCENGRTGGRVGGSHSRGRARSLFFR